ncbi:hypothetical protein DIPPA_17128 [Diplonema papillatum]|nr:hypothetical protein DIPPA_17128 [Diplonema papillatum]
MEGGGGGRWSLPAWTMRLRTLVVAGCFLAGCFLVYLGRERFLAFEDPDDAYFATCCAGDKYRRRCNTEGRVSDSDYFWNVTAEKCPGKVFSYATDCGEALAEWRPGTCGDCWVKKTCAAVRLVVVDDDASEHLTFMSIGCAGLVLFCYCGRLLIGHVERRLDRFADELV